MGSLKNYLWQKGKTLQKLPKSNSVPQIVSWMESFCRCGCSQREKGRCLLLQLQSPEQLKACVACQGTGDWRIVPHSIIAVVNSDSPYTLWIIHHCIMLMCVWVSSVPTLRGVCFEVCIRPLTSCNCDFGLFYTAEHCLQVFLISHKENNYQNFKKSYYLEQGQIESIYLNTNNLNNLECNCLLITVGLCMSSQIDLFFS